MKRSLALLTAIWFILLLFVSCAGGKSDRGETNASPQIPVGTAAQPSDGALQTDPATEPGETAAPADDREYVFDYNNARCSMLFSEMIFETEDTVYCMLKTSEHAFDGFVYFSDKDYKDWMPLCSKPNCRHTGEDCSAMTEGSVNNVMWIYGRHIYYAFRDIMGDGNDMEIQLWRMKLDGSDHEKLLAFSVNESARYKEACKITPPVISYGWYFHNKYFIIRNDYLFLNEEGEAVHTTIHDELAFDLSDLKKPPVDLNFVNAEGAQDNGSYILAGKGKLLYRVTKDYKTVIRQNLETGQTDVLCTMPCELNSRGSQLEGDTLYVMNYLESPDQPARIYAVGINTGEYELFSETVSEPFYVMGEGMIFGTVLEGEYEGLERGFYIYGLNGELLSFIPYEETGGDIHAYYVSDKYVLGYESSDYSKPRFLWRPPEYYMEISDILNGSPHWQKWGE